MADRYPENHQAYNLAGNPIRIRGRGGSLEARGINQIKTGHGGEPAKFIMEFVSSSPEGERLVAFRLQGSEDLYLTQNPYGNSAKAATLENISSSRLPLLPEISQVVVDYAVASESTTGEGTGFDYSFMRLEKGPPGLLQRFSLTGTGLHRVGIKSVYGKFWRAPGWSKGVLQSPHQLGDENFSFSIAE